jgi:hydroxybutyrate-dimer hydrolase
VVEGASGNLRYVEVLNAQHLDTLNALEALGFADLYIPLHHYFIQALDIMLDHLRNGAPLPPSQVVRTTPRQRVGGALQPVTEEGNLPGIASAPDAGSLITFEAGQVRIPD